MFFFKKRNPAPEPDNRRGPYRVLPHEVGQLSVQLSGQAMAPVVGQLVDLSIHGVGVRLPGGRSSDLIGGDVYDVRIGSKIHPDIATPVQLRSAVEEEESWRYGFEFIDIGDLYGQLDDFFVRYFNRRTNKRMRLLGSERIPLEMSWDGGSRTVQVADISGSGVGFALSAQDLPALEEGDWVAVSLRLPGVEQPLSGYATLARLTLLADRFVLGLAFDLDDPEGFGATRHLLEGFVDERARLRAAWNTLAS